MSSNTLFNPERYQHQRQLMEDGGARPGEVFWTEATRDMMARVIVHGVPNRFSHWTFGERYLRMLQSSGRLYEFVVWGNAIEAYIDDTLSPAEAHMIAAHVLGHADCMRNNFRFNPQYRLEPEDWMRHAQWIDGNTPETTKNVAEYSDRYLHKKDLEKETAGEDWLIHVFPARELLEQYDALDLMMTVSVASHPPWERVQSPTLPPWAKRPTPWDTTPPEAARDDALTTMHRTTWANVDTLDILKAFARPQGVRELAGIFQEEEDYFHVLKSTKLINEGWATYWHHRVGGTEGTEQDVWEQASLRSGVELPGMINPYWLGSELFRLVEEAGDDPRWLMEHCDDASFLQYALTPERLGALEIIPMLVKSGRDPEGNPAWEWYHDTIDPDVAVQRVIDHWSIGKEGIGTPILRWVSPKEVAVEGVWGIPEIYPDAPMAVDPLWFFSLATLLGRTLTVRLPKTILWHHQSTDHPVS